MQHQSVKVVVGRNYEVYYAGTSRCARSAVWQQNRLYFGLGRFGDRYGKHLDVPYRVGQYGGAAFLIPYFLFVALFGAVGLSGEFALGRLTGTGPVGSYDYAMRTLRFARRKIAPMRFRCSVRSGLQLAILSLSAGCCVRPPAPRRAGCSRPIPKRFFRR